jgi:predicted CxxxxCH...CXXCH cytochrome family protein
MPNGDVISGTHANGSVEVRFDTSRTGPEVSYDPSTKSCSVSCHDRGGAVPRPAWAGKSASRCGDCHTSPPARHYRGACTQCHAEANADGTALDGGPLHVNGRVDLGNGNGTCSACHGRGSSPYPPTAAHPSHESPTLADQVNCDSCHPVPAAVDSPGHMNGAVEIAFTGRASARNATPTWNGTACAGVACHGAGLDTVATPVWKDTSHASSACGACHGIPPQNHTPASTCESAICHGTETAPTATGAQTITAFGRTLHVNGAIDHAN